MSTTGAGKQDDGKRPKPSFDSTSSATRISPSNVQETLEQLFADLKLQLGSNEGQRQCDRVAGNTPRKLPGPLSEVLRMRRRTQGDQFETHSPDLIEPLSTKQFGTSAELLSTEAAESGAGFAAGAEGGVEEKPRGIDLYTQVNIVRQVQEIIQENGPLQEGELLQTLCPSQARMILEAYGTLAAFLERQPGFAILHKGASKFIYCRDLIEGGDSSHSSFMERTIKPGPSEDVSKNYKIGQLRAASGDGPPQPVWCNSSSNISTEDIEEEEEELPALLIKEGSPLAPSHPLHSIDRQRVTLVCDAEAQTLGSSPEWLSELEYTLEQQNDEIADLQEVLKDLQLSPARETKDLREEVFKQLKRPAPPPPWSVTAERKMRSVVNEQTLTAAGGSCAEDSPLPPPGSLVCARCPSFRPKQEGKQRASAVYPNLSPLFTGDKEPRGPLKRPPVPQFPEHPGMASEPQAGPTVDKKMRMSAEPPVAPDFSELPSPADHIDPLLSGNKSEGSLKRPPVSEVREVAVDEARSLPGPTVDKKSGISAEPSAGPEFFQLRGRRV
ncbi:hypothetical protein HPB50_024778 [Hyalomma asiaticum]|uniref:Uncharacterized protein n=1 Tax=Hyalomma asiaticum TaxID=266040 RepID=A0ACB7T8V0_HYAAI|nr:hypothetical protein HPB50_024778 [Hyalomma asiaticum]